MRNRFHPDVSYKMKRKKLNKDATAFWYAKIRGAFSRAAQRSSGGGICKEWNGPDGRVAMYEYVMQLWNTQNGCLLYTSPSPRDRTRSRMPSSA